MERATFVRMKSLITLAAVATLGACTDAGTREAEQQDSAMRANEQPLPAAQPVQAETAATTPTRAPATTTPSPATTPGPTQTRPPLREPPPPRDTRPSIPYPPDTI